MITAGGGGFFRLEPVLLFFRIEDGLDLGSQQPLELAAVRDPMPLGPLAQGLDDFCGRAHPEVGGHETHLELVQRRFIHLAGEGDNRIQSLVEALARARDRLLHPAEEAFFFGFFQAAKESLNHLA